MPIISLFHERYVKLMQMEKLHWSIYETITWTHICTTQVKIHQIVGDEHKHKKQYKVWSSMDFVYECGKRPMEFWSWMQLCNCGILGWSVLLSCGVGGPTRCRVAVSRVLGRRDVTVMAAWPGPGWARRACAASCCRLTVSSALEW